MRITAHSPTVITISGSYDSSVAAQIKAPDGTISNISPVLHSSDAIKFEIPPGYKFIQLVVNVTKSAYDKKDQLQTP